MAKIRTTLRALILGVSGDPNVGDRHAVRVDDLKWVWWVTGVFSGSEQPVKFHDIS